MPDIGEQRGISQRSALVGTEDCVFESPWNLGFCVGCNILSIGVFGEYTLASSTLARLVASMRVLGSGMVGMCAVNIPPGAWVCQSSKGPYTRLPLGV